MVEVGLENMRLKMLEYGVNHHYAYLLWVMKCVSYVKYVSRIKKKKKKKPDLL